MGVLKVGNKLIPRLLNTKDYRIIKIFMTVIRDYETSLKRLAKVK